MPSQSGQGEWEETEPERERCVWIKCRRSRSHIVFHGPVSYRMQVFTRHSVAEQSWRQCLGLSMREYHAMSLHLCCSLKMLKIPTRLGRTEKMNQQRNEKQPHHSSFFTPHLLPLAPASCPAGMMQNLCRCPWELCRKSSRLPTRFGFLNALYSRPWSNQTSSLCLKHYSTDSTWDFIRTFVITNKLSLRSPSGMDLSFLFIYR